jgi:hypothetical protein
LIPYKRLAIFLKRNVMGCTLKGDARVKRNRIHDIFLTLFMVLAVQDGCEVRRWEGAALLQIQR